MIFKFSGQENSKFAKKYLRILTAKTKRRGGIKRGEMGNGKRKDKR